jgi:hypothetical protein
VCRRSGAFVGFVSLVCWSCNVSNVEDVAVVAVQDVEAEAHGRVHVAVTGKSVLQTSVRLLRVE